LSVELTIELQRTNSRSMYSSSFTLVLTMFNGGAYLTFKSIFHKTLQVKLVRL